MTTALVLLSLWSALSFAANLYLYFLVQKGIWLIEAQTGTLVAQSAMLTEAGEEIVKLGDEAAKYVDDLRALCEANEIGAAVRKILSERNSSREVGT